MKLYNKSKCPDKLLQPIIMAAARRVGVRTGVVVKVLGPARTGYQGMAYRGRPYQWHLTRKRLVGKYRKREIASDGGWIELHIPRRHPSYDHLLCAEMFYALCVHEWSHIKDYQDETRGIYKPTSRRGHGGRRERHDDRPEEIRACAAVRRATEVYYSPTAEAAILELGLWLAQPEM